MRRLGQVMLVAGIAMGACLGVACAQTPASQQNESPWKQTPEGRPAVQPQSMNCSGSITSGDGKVEKISDCPTPNAQPQAPTSASQQFPYPGDSKPAPQTTPATPAANQAPGSSGQQPASKQFPYPGEDAGGSSSSSAGAAKPADTAGDGLQDAGSSGTSSPSSSSSSSSAGPDNGAGNGAGADGDTGTVAPVRVRRRRVPAAPRLTPTQREAEDLQVAGFYQNDGDFRGAYLRAKDAVSIADADPDAHLALGEAARKIGKLDEAEQNYRRCLELDPVPKTRKTAEKALKEMTGGA